MSETNQNKLELLTTALSFLEDNLTEKITTEDVAKVCYCSKSTLEKLFRCVSHMSVHDYIIRRRMTKAAKMLFFHREISILDIAVLYGYNSNEAFTRAFKQVWNCTPSEFRNNTRYSELFPRFAFDLDKGEQIMKKVDISELYDVLRERIGCHYLIGDIVGLIPINDISRAAGDLALIEAMNRLNSVAGENDIVFRIGADEFVLLTDSKDMEHINKLASEIEGKNGDTFAYEGKDIPLSLYVLVSTLNKGAHGDCGEMFNQFQKVVNDFKRSIGRPGM
jgi:AraC family transcriptional regulator